MIHNNADDCQSGMLLSVEDNGSRLLVRPTLNLTFNDNYNLNNTMYLIQAQELAAPSLVSAFSTALYAVDDTTTTFDWQLDEAVNNLEDGSYTVYFLVVDDAGNFSIHDWDFQIDKTAPTAIVWAEGSLACRTTPNANNSIDLNWTNPAGAVKNHIWALSYSSLCGTSPAYPEYPTSTNEVPAAPDPYLSTVQDGWTLIEEIDAAGSYLWTGMDRDYYYITVFVEDAAGNISAAPEATFYRESISYWPGDVDGVTPDGTSSTVTASDIVILSTNWGLLPGNNLVDVGPTVGRARRGRPTPDNRINIEDLMIFAMNYGNTDYETYIRADAEDEMPPIQIEMQTLIAGNLMTVNLYLSDNMGQLQGLGIPLQFGNGLIFEALENGNIWPEDSMILYTLENNVLELSASTLGETGLVEDNGLIASLSFRILAEGTELELLSMIARDHDNHEIEIINNPSSGPSGNGDLVEVIPTANYLGSNYPNPFNPTTTLQFGLNQAQNVKITIFNTRGQVVKQLVSGMMPAGIHNIVWNGRDDNNQAIASGMYFYRMETSDYVKTNKAILMK